MEPFCFLSTSILLENAVTLLCCDAPEIFLWTLKTSPDFPVSNGLSRQRLNLNFRLNLSLNSPFKFCYGICFLPTNVCGSSEEWSEEKDMIIDSHSQVVEYWGFGLASGGMRLSNLSFFLLSFLLRLESNSLPTRFINPVGRIILSTAHFCKTRI